MPALFRDKLPAPWMVAVCNIYRDSQEPQSLPSACCCHPGLLEQLAVVDIDAVEPLRFICEAKIRAVPRCLMCAMIAHATFWVVQLPNVTRNTIPNQS